ncbi:MAG: hypothetical protein ACFFD4_17870 [Candidatus Odinarchaeota archaeon]
MMEITGISSTSCSGFELAKEYLADLASEFEIWFRKQAVNHDRSSDY